MKTIVIAEIGENHYGQWDLCRGLTQEAARNGATIAKYQTYTGNQFPANHPERDWFQRVSMPARVHFEMRDLCLSSGIRFLSSPFSVGAARFLVETMGLNEIKIASSVLLRFPVLDYLNDRADMVKTIYLSTGMATVAEIRESLAHLQRIDKIYLLHCVSQYPTEDSEANLRCITTLQREFPGIPTGYSDHTRGIEACMAAVALGAEVIEKHFTYHTAMPGTDHAGGMTPSDLKEMTQKIERIEKLLGSPEKRPTASEAQIVELARTPLAETDIV